MFKKFNKILFVFALVFMFIGGVNAEEWLYQRQYLTSHHSIDYKTKVGRANLHILEDVSTASSNTAGDGNTMYAFCSDVDAGGYQGTYVRSLIKDSDYNGKGAQMKAILRSSYPYISLESMKSLYTEQTGKSIDGLTYQEAITATQAAIWSLSNPNYTPYTFGGNIDNDKMLKLTHNRLGITCDWSITDPSKEGYCYPNGTEVYETNSAVAGERINAVINWLLTMDPKEADATGEVKINVLSKEYKFDEVKNKNIAKVSFSVSANGVTMSDTSSTSIEVIDSKGNSVGLSYSNGVFSFEKEYSADDDKVSFSISYNRTSTTLSAAYVFKSTGNQDLVSAFVDVVDKNAMEKVELENTRTGDVKISKVAITGGPELPGAKLVVKDSTGKVIDEWISTNEVHEVKGLKEGKYTLTELTAPEGYVTATTIEFEIKNKQVSKVEMVDEVTKVVISKKDITTEKEVPGAKLEIKDSTGKTIHEWISTTEPHYIEKLPVGKYTLTETIYPDGYQQGMIIDGVLTTTYAFEVKDTKEIQKIDVYNRADKITEVPSTGINDKSMMMGISIIAVGGMIIVFRKKIA